MRPHTLLASLAVVGSLSAQGALTTATDYVVFADALAGSRQGVPAGTSIGASGLAIRAADSAFSNSANASTQVGFIPTIAIAGTAGIGVTERGDAFSVSPPTSAGTANGRSPGAHDLTWQLRALPGARAAIVVTWRAAASVGAMTGASVDVDGDGTPDFGERITAGRADKSARFDVTAGRQGFTIGVSTVGLAQVGLAELSSTTADYDATLNVVVQILSPGCRFTAFGRECAGKLEGSEVGPSPRRVIDLQLSGAAPSALAALVLGDALPAGVPLPGSRCFLLVNPAALLPGQTDPRGNASWQVGLPGVAGFLGVSVSCQAVTLDLSGPTLGSSNGILAECP
ncbi:MAG: hypothetical protein AAF628_08820 [Planctomycetota bacterium]